MRIVFLLVLSIVLNSFSAVKPLYRNFYQKKQISNFSDVIGGEWTLVSTTGTCSADTIRTMEGRRIVLRASGAATVVLQKVFSDTVDLSKYSHVVFVLSDSCKNGKLQQRFSNNGFTGYITSYPNFSNSLRLEEVGYKLYPNALNTASAWVASGTGWDSTKVTSMRIELNTTSGSSMVILYGCYLVKSPLAKAQVHLQFDDGWRDAYVNGWNIMKQYNLVGTFGVCTGAAFRADPHFMTTNQITDLQRNGNCIVSHTQDHTYLDSIPVDSVVRALQGSQYTLDSMGIVGYRMLIYPYTSFAYRTQKIASNYYDLCFSGQEYPSKTEMVPIMNRYGVIRYGVTRTTSTATAITYVLDAIRTKTIAIPFFHTITDSTYTLSRWSPDSFSIFCRALDSLRNLGVLEVKTADEFVEESFKTPSYNRGSSYRSERYRY